MLTENEIRPERSSSHHSLFSTSCATSLKDERRSRESKINSTFCTDRSGCLYVAGWRYTYFHHVATPLSFKVFTDGNSIRTISTLCAASWKTAGTSVTKILGSLGRLQDEASTIALNLLSHGNTQSTNLLRWWKTINSYFAEFSMIFLTITHALPSFLRPRSMEPIMTDQDQKRLSRTLWAIADQPADMNADDFATTCLRSCFPLPLGQLRAGREKELGRDYPDPSTISNGGRSSLSVCTSRTPAMCRSSRSRCD